jgi:hypothetical protein
MRVRIAEVAERLLPQVFAKPGIDLPRARRF